MSMKLNNNFKKFLTGYPKAKQNLTLTMKTFLTPFELNLDQKQKESLINNETIYFKLFYFRALESFSVEFSNGERTIQIFLSCDDSEESKMNLDLDVVFDISVTDYYAESEFYRETDLQVKSFFRKAIEKLFKNDLFTIIDKFFRVYIVNCGASVEEDFKKMIFQIKEY